MKSSLGNWLIQKVGKWLLKETSPKRPYLSDFNKVRQEVRPGDILLIEGNHRVSNIIKQITQSPWSHAAIYLGRLHDVTNPAARVRLKRFFKGRADQQLIIESMLGSGTSVNILSHYKNDHIRICRPLGLTHDDAQRVINFAIERLGRTYSLRHIFDLARFMVPWSLLPRRWRSSLFSHHALKPTEEICSSMLAEAFASVKFPIVPIVKYDKKKGLELIQRNPRLYTPSDFDYSPYFAIIKYPIFSVAGHAPYRNLPWKEGVQSDK